MAAAIPIRIVKALGARSQREARKIIREMPDWAAQRIDHAIDQPSRAAGRFGSGIGRPVGSGLKVVGGGAAVGGVAVGGGQFYDAHTRRKTAAEENEIDAARAEAIAALLKDPNRSDEEKMALIKALDDADFFRNTDITPESWAEKLGLTPGSLNPVRYLGGGIGGYIILMLLVWMAVRIAQSRGGA